MPVKAPARAPVLDVFSWTGFYIGGHVGGAWAHKDWDWLGGGGFPFGGGVTFPAPVGSHSPGGAIGGGQIGFNVQSGRWVFGVEAQASWSDLDGSHQWPNAVVPFFGSRTEIEWLGTIAGRVGYTFDRVLLFVKAGGAWTREEYSAFRVDSGETWFTGKFTRWGWMAGTGLEWAFTNAWSAKIEYNFMDFGAKSFALPPAPGQAFPSATNVDVDQHVHVVKVGINYRFGPAAVVARY